MQTNTRLRDTGLAAVVLASILASGYLVYSGSRSQGIAALEREAEKSVESAATALFAPTDKFSYLPELVASHPVIIDSLLHKNDARRIQSANALLQRFNESAQSAAIYVLDDRGTAIASSNWQNPQSFVGRNYAFRPYFDEAIRTGSGRFYGMGTTSKQPGYYVSYGIMDGPTPIGVAVAKVDMTKVDAGWTRNKDEVAVTDENGVIFLSSRAEWKYRPLHPLSDAALETLKRTRQYETVLNKPFPMTLVQSLRENTHIVDIADANGNAPAESARYLMQSRPLAGSDWTIHVMIPMEEVDHRALKLAALTGAALGLVALSLLLLWQGIARAQDREKSRRALEQAHNALEQQHSELQKISEDLRITSITDPLTGAHNRRFFFESAPKIVSAVKRHRFPLSVVTIDVDHFKRINDMYGHPAGDKVLRALTTICKESLREADLFARFGGEEFIMALPNSDAEAARCAAERLRVKVMERPVEVKGDMLSITISCGVSQYRDGEPGIEQALKRADDALYDAKKTGRNRVVVN